MAAPVGGGGDARRWEETRADLPSSGCCGASWSWLTSSRTGAESGSASVDSVIVDVGSATVPGTAEAAGSGAP